MAELLDGRARYVDGRAIEAEALDGSLPPGVGEARIHFDDSVLRVVVDPARGARVRLFKRRSIALDPTGGEAREREPSTVIEIAPDPERPERYVRLYVGPEIVLSTEDLYG